eukprot:EC822699.1.p1 GENE.EC822699.1~~EC822699.1.p1  ORF type:complete len:195 (+),score=73.08 EC822699.1:50-586(+)
MFFSIETKILLYCSKNFQYMTTSNYYSINNNAGKIYFNYYYNGPLGCPTEKSIPEPKPQPKPQPQPKPLPKKVCSPVSWFVLIFFLLTGALIIIKINIKRRRMLRRLIEEQNQTMPEVVVATVTDNTQTETTPGCADVKVEEKPKQQVNQQEKPQIILNPIYREQHIQNQQPQIVFLK